LADAGTSSFVVENGVTERKNEHTKDHSGELAITDFCPQVKAWDSADGTNQQPSDGNSSQRSRFFSTNAWLQSV
jgi:hypothetical protein